MRRKFQLIASYALIAFAVAVIAFGAYRMMSDLIGPWTVEASKNE